MNYSEPKVMTINAAVTTIQGQQPGSKVGSVPDGQGMNQYITASAYEADE